MKFVLFKATNDWSRFESPHYFSFCNTFIDVTSVIAIEEAFENKSVLVLKDTQFMYLVDENIETVKTEIEKQLTLLKGCSCS